jgi:PEP-CTERM motif
MTDLRVWGCASSRRRLSRWLACPLLLGSAAACTAFGDSIVVFNTGESGGVAQTVGQTDTHYSLISAPANVPLTAIATARNGAWTANTATADWISPGSSGATSWPVGNYDYQTTFDLSGLNPSTAQLSGSWASDNNGCIFLNGANTGDCTGFAAFGSLTAFSITSGFVSGVNTLDFEVTNGGGPSGVIAEASGTATAASGVTGPSNVPEPSSLLMVGASLLGVGGLLRRKLYCRRPE